MKSIFFIFPIVNAQHDNNVLRKKKDILLDNLQTEKMKFLLILFG